MLLQNNIISIFTQKLEFFVYVVEKFRPKKSKLRLKILPVR